ncbi:DUF1707 SHOCT-like domain-containing protein [Nocardioides piscis]|uniref:DUF1707 domain-containing protein n=1 Tax=Nocardioides piscis TaxID=2714938 RepID=A0A6G7YC33_9ACTN|nr:DUF1707 domain-containing protein [Nocardioides piscis]QIK74198.1 DUF1707 domain-containing protein [Nocardioides piscis]
MGEMENRPHDPSQMRIGDDDRHKVAELLRTAAGEGRLDLDELDERLEATWSAKTYADLIPITADLHPAAPVAHALVPRAGAGAPAVPGHASSVAIMGDCKRRGAWHVPANHAAFSLMGSVVLDLREATLTSPDTLINASAIMGDVKILVPAHFHVVVDGTPIMGDYGQGRDKVPADLRPDSPTVRVRGMALMGSVQVQRLPAPGTPKKYLGSY